MAIPRQLYQAVVLCVAIHLAYQQQNAMGDDDGYFYYQKSDYPKDCQDVLNQCTETDSKASGVYWIKPEGYEEPFEVYCDQVTEDGGWTVFQRRKDNGDVGFSRNWDSYKKGFGFLNQEFWMGNDKLAYLTNQRTYILRIDMIINGQERYAEYNAFRITDEKGFYEMVQLGTLSPQGVTNDQMRGQLNQPFSTSDQPGTSNCPLAQAAGGWWFAQDCNLANLNGLHTGTSHPGFYWALNDDVTFSEMKVKPVSTT